MSDEPREIESPMPGDHGMIGIFRREAEIAKLRREAEIARLRRDARESEDIPVLERHRGWAGPPRWPRTVARFPNFPTLKGTDNA